MNRTYAALVLAALVLGPLTATAGRVTTQGPVSSAKTSLPEALR